MELLILKRMTDKREELKTNFDLKRSKYLPILKSKYEEIA